MNGENIESSIKEMFNVYEFSKRSDGFKRFITFLLTVSTQVKTNKLTDALYIHDEPEISLHPSGARYLLDELIKISATNYVIFSTHSIFMIDREKTERHYIVNKKDEVTTIDQVNESNITDEEVIYNALGYSVFENLKLRNIIFEGWKDKKLFEIAIGKIPSALNNLKILTEIGLCHAKGVKDITRVVNIL